MLLEKKLTNGGGLEDIKETLKGRLLDEKIDAAKRSAGNISKPEGSKGEDSDRYIKYKIYDRAASEIKKLLAMDTFRRFRFVHSLKMDQIY